MKRVIFGLVLAAAVLAQGCISLPPFAFGANRGKVTMEVIEDSEHFWTTDQILMIPLSGLVAVGDMRSFRGEPGMLVALKDRLKEAEDNPRIKAVVLRIDSPGGTVTAADLIYQEIVRFKEKQKIPVIALMTDVAASGGFYIAMAADEVYALPTTVTGSIGVIMTVPGLQGLAGKLGFEMRVIKSGANKDIGSMWRDMTPEERKIFQDLINKYYELFLKVIIQGRKHAGLTMEKLREVADGRVLDPQTAQAARLIDGIKYPNEVFERARELAKVKDAEIVSYEYPFSYRGNIYAQGGAPAPKAERGEGGDVNLFKFDLEGITGIGSKPQFMYLWMP